RSLLPRCPEAIFSSHAFFGNDKLKAAFGWVEKRGPAAASDLPGWHHPYLSGIAISGANRSVASGEDDQILTAGELEFLDLSGLDLLTLSMCESALGSTSQGEGLVGLTRAAHVAGARTVVASLWLVDDAVTRRLMTRFCQNLWVR